MPKMVMNPTDRAPIDPHRSKSALNDANRLPVRLQGLARLTPSCERHLRASLSDLNLSKGCEESMDHDVTAS